MATPQDLFYAKTHEWVSLDEGIATVGITDFAQSQLSDLTFVELPEVGAEFKAGDEAAVVESVKAAADIYAPVASMLSTSDSSVIFNLKSHPAPKASLLISSGASSSLELISITSPATGA